MTKNKSEMAKTTPTPLENKYQALAQGLVPAFLEALKTAEISRSTFDRDRKANPTSIPSNRLLIYSSLLDCDMAELLDTYGLAIKKKVKSVVKKKSLADKAGLRTSND